jgi:ABC-type nitrate/sulfonate/bicarbonate transport system substrate-binding protein
VGYTRPGSTTDIGTHAGLKKVGLDADKDVELVQSGTAQQNRDALLSGAIQGAMQQPPETLVLESKGFHALFDFADLGLPAANAVIAVRRSWLADHRDVAQKYVDSIVQATAREKADKTLTMNVVRKYFKNEDEGQAETTWDYFSKHIHPPLPYPRPEQFTEIVSIGAQTNPKVKDFDVGSILDAAFVKSAEDRGLARG